MHATSVYITRKQFVHHQTVERTQARSEDFLTCVVREIELYRTYACMYIGFAMKIYS